MCVVKHIREVCRSCGQDNWLGGNIRETITLYCSDRMACQAKPCRPETRHEETVVERGAFCNTCIKAGNSYSLACALTAGFPRLDVGAVAKEHRRWLIRTTGVDDVEEMAMCDYEMVLEERQSTETLGRLLDRVTAALGGRKKKRLDLIELENYSKSSGNSSSDSSSIATPQEPSGSGK
ncbi:hypothetical protein SUNI508_12873 [Seiridium unicorne]|uniref:Uncharacterized protein n=1 Tax=Seiridium unicorne TaxID=138068 RepID=A0ABR2VFY0_9PEZI